MREHTKKPISRAEAKKAVLKERPDTGGKIMKALLVHANEKLLALCGLELVPEGGSANGAGEEEADASQAASQSSQGASQSSQGASQGGRATGGARYVLANRLEPIVRSTPSKQAAEYHALVMVVLELLAHAEGSMEARARRTRATSVAPQRATPACAAPACATATLASWSTQRAARPLGPGGEGGMRCVMPRGGGCPPVRTCADLTVLDGQETTLLDHWLSTKLRAPKDQKLPNQRQKIEELVTKTMVAEAWLKRSKQPSTLKGASLQQPHAATRLGRRPPTCLRLPSGPEKSPSPRGCPSAAAVALCCLPRATDATAFWPSRNASTGKIEYSAGPRATLTRDMAASDSFVKSL